MGDAYTKRGNWFAVLLTVVLVSGCFIGLQVSQDNELNISAGSSIYFLVIFLFFGIVLAFAFSWSGARLWHHLFPPSQRTFSKVLILFFSTLFISFFVLNLTMFINSRIGPQNTYLIRGTMKEYIDTSNRTAMIFLDEESGKTITLNLEGCSEETVKVGDKFEYRLKKGSLGFLYVPKGMTGRSNCRKIEATN